MFLAWYGKGITFYNLEDYLEALECYDKALKLDSMYFDLWIEKGVVLAKLKYTKSLNSFNMALEIEPEK